MIGGNDNGLLDPGENVILTFSAENIGHAGIYNAYGHLTCTSTYITINNNETYIDTLNVNETFGNDFSISIDSSAPVGTIAEFQFIFGDAHYKDTLNTSLPIGLIIESFETGDFSAYNWQQGGDANWTVVSDAPQDGSYCAQSGDIDNNQTSEMSLQLNNVPAGQSISFYYKVSSESTYDFLKFYVNGTEVQTWSGEIPWTQYTYNFSSAGNYTIKFAYEKDGSVSNGLDSVWIDYLVLPVAPAKSAKGLKAITITAPTLPSWASFTDNGDGTAKITGTTPANNENDPVVLEATDGTNTISQEFTIRVGVTEIQTSENVVKFFPNPTSDILNIQLSDAQDYELIITDINGKILIHRQIHQQNTQIDLTGFAKGTYLLKLNLNGKALQNKIIIQ
jgi:hypothetical protein